MQDSPIDARALAATGIEALRRGNAHEARESFERIASQGQADAGIFLALAQACTRLKDHVAARAALENVLALEPRNVLAMIMKADYLETLGDSRSASFFYQTAIQVAPPLDQLPTELRNELGRAQAKCQQYAAQFESFLKEKLVPKGMLERGAADRFRQSFDIMLGKKSIFFQQPRIYFFPGLPQIQFYDRNQFPWFDRIEAATADIRAEMLEVLKDNNAFKPYVENDPKRPRGDNTGLQENPDWSAFYLLRDGEIVPENAARCPKTIEALSDFPLVHVPNRSPSVLFSLLRPGARIPPHTGIVNTRLICHLPLLVPPGCALRVGNDTRVPVEGKAWLFDDTMEHEAWNLSDRPRVILLFEMWRPELTDKERELIRAMFGAIDMHTGRKPEWEI
ncbi:MAG: aspartyl/asparaginyl beta-hydroxylase domain-containing protein [Betaproteobacteria bacterium]